MKYITCPTCGYFIGCVSELFDKEKEKICSNPKYDENKKNKEIQKLIKSLPLRRLCCKMRVLTYKNLVKDILPVPKTI